LNTFDDELYFGFYIGNVVQVHNTTCDQSTCMNAERELPAFLDGGIAHLDLQKLSICRRTAMQLLNNHLSWRKPARSDGCVLRQPFALRRKFRHR
jgi:hypothetical protein